MFLLRLGELLEEWTHKKSVENLARSMSLNIDRVWMKTEKGEELLPLHQVQAGDQVVVRMGGMIPLDGTIVEGEVMVNQASLTGESIPVPKRPGSSVYAGTVVEEGECVLTVTQQSGEGRYDKIVAMIEESEQLKSAAENHAAHLADQLVPYTLAGSALVYLLTRNVTRALSVLMVDFSCALKLSMPLAVLSAMSEASRFHVTVKGGKYLEAVAQADTIVFDKTGTLTHASPVVAQVIPFGGNKEPEMLRLAACLEEHFPHSMANAVVQAARERGIYVCNNKGCNAESVAEHTIMLMLMALRFGIPGHNAVIQGQQIQMKQKAIAAHAPGLFQCAVGLVGFGDTAQATARRLASFGCKLYYYTRHRRPPQVEEDFGVTYLPLEELTAQCDIISLHCAVTDETREMVDGAFLARMKPNSILVNCGRGDLVDNQALRKALIDGTIRGAALDTIFPEPTPGDHPLVDLPPEVRDRVVYSSHLGGSSGGAFAKAHLTMWTNARHILNGERPTNVVNGL